MSASVILKRIFNRRRTGVEGDRQQARKKPGLGYQTVGDDKGASDSEGKLERIRLPYLQGKSFLDLGCNAGFFCRAARQRGASRTVGIDIGAEKIAEARRLDPDGEYIAGDWFEKLRSLQGTFDVIIHLSAFHYVTDQREFLRLVEDRLAPGGVFILECGVVNSRVPRYVDIKRKSYTRHVTSPLLDQLLSNFAVRRMDSSVVQRGDPVPRFVFHCQRWKVTVFLLSGESHSGKSYLGRVLSGQRDIATIEMDELILGLQRCPDNGISNLMQTYFAENKGLQCVAERVVAAGKEKAFCKSIAALVPNCFKIVVMEGQVLTDGRIRQVLANELTKRGFNCWDVHRLMQKDFEISDDRGVDLLAPSGDIHFLTRTIREGMVRTRPADKGLLLVVNRSAEPTAVGWVFSPLTGQSFECSLRVDARSRPVEFVFDVLDVGEEHCDKKVFAPDTKPLKTVSQIVKGSDEFSHIAVVLPMTAGRTAIRVAVKMADARDRPQHARTFFSSPKLITR